MHPCNFTAKELKEKILNNPKCYLTGRDIDLTNARSYELDHIVPRSKNGDNTINNCGLACKNANRAKADMLLFEFLELCKNVLENHGYTVTMNSDKPV